MHRIINPLPAAQDEARFFGIREREAASLSVVEKIMHAVRRMEAFTSLPLFLQTTEGKEITRMMPLISRSLKAKKETLDPSLQALILNLTDTTEEFIPVYEEAKADHTSMFMLRAFPILLTVQWKDLPLELTQLLNDICQIFQKSNEYILFQADGPLANSFPRKAVPSSETIETAAEFEAKRRSLYDRIKKAVHFFQTISTDENAYVSPLFPQMLSISTALDSLKKVTYKLQLSIITSRNPAQWIADLSKSAIRNAWMLPKHTSTEGPERKAIGAENV